VWQGGAYRMAEVAVDRQLSWRSGVLSFDRVPLEQAVAEINRYSPQEIIVSSPQLARRPISGTFRIGVTRGFLQSLELAGIARVENESVTRAELVAP
jgi:transmembrane sensor